MTWRTRAMATLVAAGLAAVVLVAVAVGPAVAPTATAAGASASPGSGADATGQASSVAADSPSEASPAVAGLPIVTVADALAAPHDGTELAVSGFWTGTPRIPCPFLADGERSPVLPRCPDQFGYLMERSQATWATDQSGTTTSRRPDGPWLSPIVLRPDVALDAGTEPGPGDAPHEVVMLGHFGDRRSGFCPQASVAECRAQFVVDRVVRPGTTSLGIPLAWLERDAAPSDDPAAVHAAADRVVSGAPVLSIGSIDGSQVWRVEPALRADPIFGAPGATWIVRLLGADRVTHSIAVRAATGGGTGYLAAEVGATGAAPAITAP